MRIFYNKAMKLSLISASLISLLGFNVISNAAETKPSRVSSTNTSSDFKVTLLGTGTPILTPDRFGPSTLVEVGGEKILFDAGRGATLRLGQHGVMPGEITKVFLTHLHSDHLVGIDDVLLTGWLPTLGERKTPFSVWGPKGTTAMMVNMKDAYREDIDARIEYAREMGSNVADPNGVEIIPHDIKEGVVYEENGIQIVAFEVSHDIHPSYGYRINYKGHSVVISGDTKYNENLIKHSKGADVIIHEVAVARPEDQQNNAGVKLIMSKHTSVEEVGKVFSLTKPKLGVYSHIAFVEGITEKEADIVNRTNKVFSGKAVVGEDLMTITIGDKVEVQQAK